MADELKPCPFCGKDVEYFDDEGFISCMDSEGGCAFYYRIDYKGFTDEAIKAWNRRMP